jgi:hypothetical protein
MRRNLLHIFTSGMVVCTGRIRMYSIIWLVLIRIMDYWSEHIFYALKPLF